MHPSVRLTQRTGAVRSGKYVVRRIYAYRRQKASTSRLRILAGVDIPTARIGPPPAHILETEVNGEISLYDPRSESVLVLNQTASDVWRLSDGEQTLEEIVQLLAVAYQVRPVKSERTWSQRSGTSSTKAFCPSSAHIGRQG